MCRIPFTNCGEEGSGVNRKRVFDRNREEFSLSPSTPLSEVRDRLVSQVCDPDPSHLTQPLRRGASLAHGDDAEGYDHSAHAWSDFGC